MTPNTQHLKETKDDVSKYHKENKSKGTHSISGKRDSRDLKQGARQSKHIERCGNILSWFIKTNTLIVQRTV